MPCRDVVKEFAASLPSCADGHSLSLNVYETEDEDEQHVNRPLL